MIRLIQRKLIIPRGDTGTFTIPSIAAATSSDVAIFTIFDCLTHSKVLQKSIPLSSDFLTIEFTHNDTVNLPAGHYVWDIKFYKNPQYLDDELINGDEVDSYYAGYRLPECEIRETGDNLLISDNAPSAKLMPEQLDIINTALSACLTAVQQSESNVSHYPKIEHDEWFVWDADAAQYVSTGVVATGIGKQGEKGDGISNVVLNPDYTLTVTFTNGDNYTSPSIRGVQGEQGEKGEKGDAGDVNSEQLAAAIQALLPIETVNGSIVTVTDSALEQPEEINVQINPLQNLNGYDTAWGPRTTRNKCPIANGEFTSNGKICDLSLSEGTYMMSCGLTRNGAAVNRCAFYLRYADGTDSGWRYMSPGDINIRQALNTAFIAEKPVTGLYFYASETGYNASIDNTIFLSKIQIEEGSTATDYIPYSNVCPIHSWSGVNITKAASKNLANVTLTSMTDGGVTFSVNQDKTINIAGTITSLKNKAYLDEKRIIKAGKYILSRTSKAATVRLRTYDMDSNELERYYLYGNSQELAISITLDMDCWYDIYVRAPGEIGDSIDFNIGVQLQLESNADMTYAPCQNEICTINFPSENTVYSGKLNVKTGELTVLGQLWTLPVSLFDSINSSFIGYSARYGVFIRNLHYYDNITRIYVGNSVPCNAAVCVINNPTSATTQLRTTFKGSWTSVEEFRAALVALEETGEVMTYYGDYNNPITFQLTPQEITTLLGTNTFYADAGDISITYRADLQKYIDKKIAAISN